MTEISNDELRRELREVDTAQRQVERSWFASLREMFDPDRGATNADRSRFLGIPDRRGMLKFGGIGIAGAALLAACGDDSETPALSSSTTAGGAAASGATGSGASGSAALDLTLAKTAASLEFLAVETYTTAVKSGLVTTAAIGQVVMLFQSHHQAHLDALNALLASPAQPSSRRRTPR